MWGNGRIDSRIVLRFEQRLLTMTREELVAGLEELNTLGLLGTNLEDRLIIQLGQQAPELALTWSIDHIAQAGGRSCAMRPGRRGPAKGKRAISSRVT